MINGNKRRARFYKCSLGPTKRALQRKRREGYKLSHDLQAIANLADDPIRKEIDAAVSSALYLPDLSPIRELLSREPGLTAMAVSPPQDIIQDDLEIVEG